MHVLLNIFIGIENIHQFSSCWDFEFNLTVNFAPLKYKRKRYHFSLLWLRQRKMRWQSALNLLEKGNQS